MDYADNYLFDGVYLLLGEDGTVVDNKGYPILQFIDGKFWVNNHAHILTGAVQQKISQQNLKKIPMIIPDSSTFSKFDKLIQPIFVQKLVELST